MASRRPARAGTGWWASSRDATARWRLTWAPGRGRPSWTASRRSRRRPSRWRATRWAGGSRWRWRCGRRRAWSGSCSVSASPGLADRGERAARREADAALADRIEAIGAEAFAREWAAQPLFAGQPAAVAAAAHTDRLRRSAAEHAAQLRGLGTGVMPPLWDRLGELAMPVTLVVGERDAKFVAVAERMRARLPAAELVVVPGVGHAVALEAPAAVAAVLGTHPAVP